MGKHVVPDGLTNKVRSFKQWSRRHKFAAGAKDERFNFVLEWAEACESNAPTIIPDARNVNYVARLAQQLYASLLMHMEAETDNSPPENGLGVCRRLVQRFGLASAHANLNLTSQTLRAPIGKFHGNAFLT